HGELHDLMESAINDTPETIDEGVTQSVQLHSGYFLSMDKIKPAVIKAVSVTIVEPSCRMLRIKEVLKGGYYIRLDEDKVKQVYYARQNKMGHTVLAYIAPFFKLKHTNILGILRIEFDFAIEKETCVVNYDGVYKSITGYRFDKLIFDSNLKGYYIAWQEDSKVDNGKTVFIDRIKRGSQLRFVVPKGNYPNQHVLFHGGKLVIQAMTGIFYLHHAEFDTCTKDKPATHYLLRCDFMYLPKAEEIPYAFEYQRIYNIDERRLIVYTVIPIIKDEKPLGIQDMFPVPPKLLDRGAKTKRKKKV
ncbi:MAG: hypothetical protein EZS28_045962, partial [Streblomastix strix]